MSVSDLFCVVEKRMKFKEIRDVIIDFAWIFLRKIVYFWEQKLALICTRAQQI